MLVFAGSDARADVEEFKRSGPITYEPLDFGREATLPDGQVARVEFSLAFVTHPRMPALVFFTWQQRNPPELFWKPEYQRHANGAERLVEVVMSVSEPAGLGDFFGRLTGGQVTIGHDSTTVRIGHSSDRISVLDPARARERFPELNDDVPTYQGRTPSFVGYCISVPDLLALRRLLDQNSVPYRSAAHSIVVSPSAAHGVAVEFSDKTADASD